MNAFLHVIRKCEGTDGPKGYRMLFGGALFDDFSDHPNIWTVKGNWKSTAAGAYQILYSTWTSLIQPHLSLPDFSPDSQDKAGAFLVDHRRAAEDAKAGRLELAVAKCNKEWASLAGSPYGQPTHNIAEITEIFTDAGGVLSN